MAILIRSVGAGRTLKLSLLAAGLLGVAGCLVLEQFGWDSAEPQFNHQLHVEQEEIDCMSCHMWYEDEEQAGFPTLAACLLCHEDLDEEAAPARRASAFFEDGEFKFSQVDALDPEIKFSHLAHVTDEEGCMDCHEAVVRSEGIRPWMATNMTQCVDCHEAGGQSSSCDTCHEEVREDVEPWTHDGGWDRFHGLGVRDQSQLTVDQCAMCHEESSCVSCHQDQMPTNHNNYWRRRAHGLTAQLDRRNCAACHRTDFCDRCHMSATPQSHNGIWGGTKNTHCLSCHTSGQDQSCSLCHSSGAPSHSLAPPKPPGHIASSDCRSCHMILGHVDNGQDCNSCHN